MKNKNNIGIPCLYKNLKISWYGGEHLWSQLLEAEAQLQWAKSCHHDAEFQPWWQSKTLSQSKKQRKPKMMHSKFYPVNSSTFICKGT